MKKVIADYLDDQGFGDGLHLTPVPGLYLFKASRLEMPMHAIYRPSLCIVAQGAKYVAFDDQIVHYGVGQALVVSVELPAVGRVTQATSEEPYFAVALEFDVGTIRQVRQEMAHPPRASGGSGLGAFVETVDEAVLDCVVRLMRLVGTPDAIAILHPGLMRELCYLMLTGRSAGEICKVVSNGSPTQRIAESIRILRDRGSAPVRMGELASAARMSSSSFHQHFKTLTSMTPLQYRKRLRLLEARGLLITNGASVADVAYGVGYESASQFSREYARMFGASPKKDAMNRRADAD
ncbi:AraC family transcriptional regulator N-terminal domain-containing protein [uncultured Sphingomonas sp.]|uniref:AraC family transcriptional regulator N-terminal domain-containing protein n=1 Tax=uncultured Sphingomonas sp. TaxID=158754 RepID=UPI0035CA2BC9